MARAVRRVQRELDPLLFVGPTRSALPQEVEESGPKRVLDEPEQRDAFDDVAPLPEQRRASQVDLEDDAVIVERQVPVRGEIVELHEPITRFFERGLCAEQLFVL